MLVWAFLYPAPLVYIRNKTKGVTVPFLPFLRGNHWVAVDGGGCLLL